MDANTPSVSSHLGNWLDRPLPRRLIPLMITLTIFCVLATYGIIRYGSISAALSRAGGQRILVDAPVKSFGEVAPGEAISVNFILRNEAPDRITIQGQRNPAVARS